MKKRNIGFTLAVMSMLIVSGCSKAADKTTSSGTSDQKESSQVSKSTESSSKKESSETATSESVEKTAATDESGNSKMLKLMVEGAQSQVPAMKEQLGGMYSDISITEAENNTVIYKYVLAQDVNPGIDVEALKPTLIKSVKPMMDGVKAFVPDLKFQVIFLNPDQSELFNFTITKEDTDSVQAD